MAKSKFHSPTLELEIGLEQVERAIKSNSGGCLVADAIKSQYPHLSGVSVDMATVRVSDRKEGKRYTYLTPPEAQHVLLAYDQGWPHPVQNLVLRRAVKITPLRRPKTGQYSVEAVAERRAARIAELETKLETEGELTRPERAALTKMRNATPAPARPASVGPREVKVAASNKHGNAVIHGGHPIPQGKAHPNLLRGRNRHFGAKLANPGQAFEEAVEAAVAERLAAVAASGGSES